MGALVAGTGVNSILVALVACIGDCPKFLWMGMGGFVLLSWMGVLLVVSGQRKVGAILGIIGCVAFVPIGLIGALGARRILDDLKKQEFMGRQEGRAR